ncbi:MAG: glycosyltransferase family 4 protein [Chloroflexi bacterium]|nr:glycosyltransferase family 4 protein [Chloroflexota bacterium]
MNVNVKRIGLNAHLLNLSGNYRSAGINWYIYHLLRNLPTGDNFAYTVFHNEPRASAHFNSMTLAPSRLPTAKPVARIFWEQFIQPFAIRNARLDLLHALAFAGPRVIGIPWVVTVYDLSFIHFPESFNVANRLYLTWAVRDAMRRADRVIAISESTRRDLIKIFGGDPRKVQVVYCGADAAFAPGRNKNELAEFRARRNVPEKMILHVGTIEPRKNIVGLVRAFARAKRAAHLPHRLVLIGARGWKHAEVDAVIEQESLRDDVIFTGYVPQDELPNWYRAADLFVYPSRYEGFGLPPLEAMASGTPVVTSNAASLPEVVGDAAIQVAPDDQVALADAIIRALTDRAMREQMRARGIAQAARFSWECAGRATADIYHAVLGREARNATT